MGIILRESEELLNATLTASASGTAVRVPKAFKGFGFVLKASAVGGTTPTFDVKIQHSHDGVLWFDVVTFTQLTADGSEYKAVTSDLLTYVRYDAVIGGTTPTALLELDFCYNNDDGRK